VAVSGGSLGSFRINRATVELAELWAARSDVAIRHVVGRRDWDEFHGAPRSPGGLVYQQVEYEQDMVSLYTAADVAVLRAGANTVAELALAGVPAVLVPLPGSPGDHQGANARLLAAAGAAVIVPDEELDGARLAKELEALLADPGRLARMGEAVKGLGRPKAAEEVARLAEEHARPRAVAHATRNAAQGDASGD
jgi:UDP-N-acetylglucosamine--N-acetylmuramyl-(pentapeptide) pyrophosphoryl-undecaprenol N-acetylglucosamine transferase